MGVKKIILSADSSCDLGKELKQKYNVHYARFHILLDNKSFLDGVGFSNKNIFETYRQKKCLPKTSAIGVGEYYEYFKKWTDQGFEVIHINASSALSSTYQNCCLAARNLDGVYPVDSKNLTTGMGLLVLEAAKCIEKGLSASKIQNELTLLTSKVQTSFVLDTLEFLHAGGRCSALTAMGANILKLRPCIDVNNTTGTMTVGKKYRGTLEKVWCQFANDKFSDVDDLNTEQLFITHTTSDTGSILSLYNYVKDQRIFEQNYITEASCVIASHCGPNTLGLMFLCK